MNEVRSDEFRRPRSVSIEVRPRTSRMAWASLALSLVLFCPITTIAGILLGLRALRAIRGNVALGGGAIAASGLVLGLVFTAAQAFVAREALRAHRLVRQGPREALTIGLAGNPSGFRTMFHGAGGRTSDDEVLTFTNELRSRYGGFIDGRPLESSPLRMPQPGRLARDYVLEFAGGPVTAEATITVADGWIVNKLQSIRIIDAERGNLVYPGDPQAPRLVQGAEPG